MAVEKKSALGFTAYCSFESTLLKMAFTEMEQLTTPHPIIINEYIRNCQKIWIFE